MLLFKQQCFLTYVLWLPEKAIPFCGNHKTNRMEEKEVKKEHTNYIEQNRHWVSIKRHIPVVLKAILFAAFLSAIQYFINYTHLAFEKDAENAILFIPVAFSFLSMSYLQDMRCIEYWMNQKPYRKQ